MRPPCSLLGLVLALRYSFSLRIVAWRVRAMGEARRRPNLYSGELIMSSFGLSGSFAFWDDLEDGEDAFVPVVGPRPAILT